MARVQLLPSELINQIAAGEVVERPASVVKELIENAIDAGASVIDVILENGGKKRIEIRDDGSGMSESDALLALERHATSKIGTFDDLTRVRTLGFRGEALPSIASVSRFSLLTSEGGSAVAVEITCDPLTGERTSRPAARDRGTTIIVRELFENVPARRKFLKSADAEFRSIVTIVTSYALPLHTLSLRVEHNGRVVLDLPAASTGRERALQILGNDAADFLEAISGSYGDAKVTGFVTRGLRFGSRRNQYFFVNNRLVRDRVLTHAANRAAESFDFEGHPAIILFLDLDAEAVDVNVHPAKTEVRFRDSGSVHVVVENSVKKALGGAEEGRELLTVRDAPYFPSPAGSDAVFDAPAPLLSDTYGNTLRIAEQAAALTPLFRSSAALVQPPRSDYGGVMPQPLPTSVEEPVIDLGDLQGRVIGQYRMSYILLDVPGGLRLVDQHVAHERVLYDQYWTRVEARAAVSQKLLMPLIYETGAAECATLDSHLNELRAVGFEIERFSGKSFAISAVPPELLREGVVSFLRKLIDASSDDRRSHVTAVREKVCASLACQAAIKVHRPLGGEEMARLVAQLLVSSNPYACPHGRPIIVDIRHLDIEKHFHRK